MLDEAIHEAIAAQISSTWSNYATIFAENQPEDRPTTTIWTRWSIRAGDNSTVDCTGLMEREVGLIVFQVFTPENGGSLPSAKLRDKVAAMFNLKRLATSDGGVIRCQRATRVYVGKQDGWLQHSVSVKFVADAPALNAA
jgi:hypothetical protein